LFVVKTNYVHQSDVRQLV